ncbi:MAG: nucleotidyltransferase family protein [Eubacteriales bacterium]|nr:nucleotidyltransferase family protein [Eubacteriales bacterium]
MVCIVLAAGYATRMYPLTENFPKPLLPVGGKPILDWLLEDVDGIEAIDRIVIVTNHKFYAHFAAWKPCRPLCKPVVLVDDGAETNETRAGAVLDMLLAIQRLNDPAQDVLVIAGDNLLEFSLRGFVGFFQTLRRACVMCYTEPDEARRRKTGIITVAGDRRVTSFAEKPPKPKSDLAVPPFYLYPAEALARIPEAIADGCPTDAPGSLAAWMSRNAELYAWPMPGKRYDIGSIDGYRAVQNLFMPPQS